MDVAANEATDALIRKGYLREKIGLWETKQKSLPGHTQAKVFVKYFSQSSTKLFYQLDK